MKRPPPGFAIRSRRDGDTLQLALFGELDLASGPALEQQLQAARSDGSTRLVIDLAGLEFMDCAGLGILLRAEQHARSQGRQVRLLPGSRQTQRLFELTGTSGLLSPDGD